MTAEKGGDIILKKNNTNLPNFKNGKHVLKYKYLARRGNKITRHPVVFCGIFWFT